MESSRTPLTRALLLHTGGSSWIDVTGMQGTRDSQQFLRWLPGSPRVELGLLPFALLSLPEAVISWSDQLAHFVLSLSPRARAPVGGSGQLAVAAATLWYAHAAEHRLPLVRAGATPSPDQPLVVLSGSGTLMQQPMEHGLFRYEIAPVGGWKEKARALGRALDGLPVMAIHLLCPRTQLATARAALVHALPGRVRAHDHDRLLYGDGASVHLHPVETLSQVARVIASLVPASAGMADSAGDDLVHRLERAHERRRTMQIEGADTRAVDAEIRRLQRRIRDGQGLQAGDVLGGGRYQLLEPAGEGGFATVWKAYDLHGQRVVAVKVLHGRWAQDASRIDGFFRGAREMARLHHPGIARVFQEHGRHGPHHFFVMEYLPGGTLHQAVLDGRLDARAALVCVLQVGDALHHAHGEGLLHRDVKPQNILLDQDGRARLADFDLVRAMETLDGSRTGVVGSLVFCAPELLAQGARADERSDLYSLAMTALFALHGRNLPSSVLRQPEEIIAGLDCSAAVKKVLARAIQLEPDQRHYGTVSALCAALRRALSDAPGRDRRFTPITRLRRHLPLRWTVRLVVLAIAATGMVLLWQAAGALREATTAEVQRAQRRAASAALAAEAWQRVETWPAQALALLRAAHARAALPIEDAARMVRDGGASLIIPSARGQAVIELAVAPDGTQAAIADADGWIELRDLRTGALLHHLDSERRGGVYPAFAADGSRLVGVARRVYGGNPWSRYRSITVWNAHTGALEHELILPGRVSLAFFDVSPPGAGGPWLAACGFGGASRVWSLAQPDARWDLPGDLCGSIRWGPHGRLAIVRRAHVELWQMDAGQPRLLHRAEQVPGYAPLSPKLAFSPDGAYLAAGSRTGLYVWETARGRLVGQWPVDAYFFVGFSAQGHRLVTMGKDDTAAQLWDTVRWERIARLEGHHARQSALALSADGSLLATGAFDGSLRIWNMATGEPLASLRGHVGHVYGLGFVAGEDGKTGLLTIAQDGTTRLWSAVTGSSALARILAPARPYRHWQQLSEDGAYLLGQARDGALRIWDVARGARIHEHAAADDQLLASLFLHRSDRFITLRRSGLVRVWALGDTVEQVQESTPPRELVLPVSPFSVVLSPDERLLVVSYKTGILVALALAADVPSGRYKLPGRGGPLAFLDARTLLVTISNQHQGGIGYFDLEDGVLSQQRIGHDGAIAAIALSAGAEARMAATASYDHTAMIWDLETGQPLHALRGHDRQVVDVAISPDDRLVATASWDTTARLWDLRTGALVHVLASHTNHVQRVAFSPDGRLLATGSKDTTVRLWDTRTGALVAVLHGHRGTIVELRFSADGARLVTQGHQGTTRTWRIAPDTLQAAPMDATGALTNLRVCPPRGQGWRVVPVLPFPAPQSVWAPAAACASP